MATIVGGIATSHVPAIGKAIAQGLEQTPYWKPFFDGYRQAQDWLARVKPDVAVIVYNDHGLNFFLDKMPTFAIGAAPEYRNEDEGWGLPTLPPFQGDPDVSWHTIESLVADEFDVTTCQEMLVDHAFTVGSQRVHAFPAVTTDAILIEVRDPSARLDAVEAHLTGMEHVPALEPQPEFMSGKVVPRHA